MSEPLARRGARIVYGAALVAIAAAGCGPSAENVAPSVTLRAVDRAAFDSVIDEHRGKAVLVDFWATWCGPCLAQLPHTRELAEQRQAEGVVVITVSMDDASARDRAAKVIAERAAAPGIEHLISTDGGGPRAMEAFEIPSGALPHYKLYDRQGKLRRTFDLDPLAEKQFTTDDIAAAVAEVLSEPAPAN